jgi:16S rRNA (uracil1498-N3)-methyltransferase
VRRFFITKDRVEGPDPFLDGEEARHLIRVLRKKVGDRLVLFDDSNREYEARIVSLTSGKAYVEILDCRTVNRESPLRLTLALPLIRPQPLEWMLQKGTELGVSAFRPFFSDYGRVTGGDRDHDHRTDRFRRIVRESAKQCGRNVLPEVYPPVSLTELLDQTPPGLKLIPYEEEKNRTLDQCLKTGSPLSEATVVIGPEGGFSEREISLAEEKGFVSLSLGPRILRSETAALTLVSLVQFLWGDLGNPGVKPDVAKSPTL